MNYWRSVKQTETVAPEERIVSRGSAWSSQDLAAKAVSIEIEFSIWHMWRFGAATLNYCDADP
jgi:hypothetical protein